MKILNVLQVAVICSTLTIIGIFALLIKFNAANPLWALSFVIGFVPMIILFKAWPNYAEKGEEEDGDY